MKFTLLLTILSSLFFNTYVSHPVLRIALSTDKQMIQKRIINRNNIETPYYVASLIYRPELNKKQIKLACGAVIIHKYWALSVSSCIKLISHELLVSRHIFLRGNTTHWDGSVRHYSDHYIQSYSTHKDYYNLGSHFDNNIAILKVKEPFVGKYEKALCIASAAYPYIENTLATVFRWELTDPSKRRADPSASELLGTDVKIVDFTACMRTYESINKIITTRMVCAMGPEINTCTGDSGGPMVQNDTLIGLVSWNMQCAGFNGPEIYTRISQFPDWILNIIKVLSDYE